MWMLGCKIVSMSDVQPVGYLLIFISFSRSSGVLTSSTIDDLSIEYYRTWTLAYLDRSTSAVNRSFHNGQFYNTHILAPACR